MRVESYAKINWSLHIIGKRADGFHDIETIFQTISLHDTLTFERADRFTLTCDDPAIPVDETNLVARAAHALGVEKVAIHIEKRIPAGGGLGGGSSNAAATLVALSKMFAIKVPLEKIALDLGSDVPFFLVGGRAHATGRGEIITPLEDLAPEPLLLVLPEERVMTTEAFRMWNGTHDPVNDFEPPVFAKLPRLREYKQRLLDVGASWAAMSGSGSTIVGRFESAAARDRAAAHFADLRVERAETITGV